MSEMLDYISTWSVIKWVILVLIAGFIGQFGRMLAEALVKRAQRKKAERAYEEKKEKTEEPITLTIPPIPDKKLAKTMAKMAKKEAKAAKKKTD
ncbi:MAG TPA: hypothetical protein PLT64_10140 [Syntrophales bacterium]|nr:hypothetical protein [Syntrophales bacterium]HOL60206.1 hypothetical protein [Syntrophales bacterium]